MNRREFLEEFGGYLFKLSVAGLLVPVIPACTTSIYAPGRVVLDGVLQARNAWTQDVLGALAKDQGMDPSGFASLLVAQVYVDNRWITAVPEGATDEQIPYDPGTFVRFQIAHYALELIYAGETPERVYKYRYGMNHIDRAVYWKDQLDGDLVQIPADVVVSQNENMVIGWYG